LVGFGVGRLIGIYLWGPVILSFFHVF